MNARQTKALKAKLIAEQQQAKTKIELPKRVNIKTNYEKKQQCTMPARTVSPQCNFSNFKQEPGMPGFKSF